MMRQPAGNRQRLLGQALGEAIHDRQRIISDEKICSRPLTVSAQKMWDGMWDGLSLF
jgi:hypothetical protein